MSNGLLKSMIAVAAVAGLTLTVGCEKKEEKKPTVPTQGQAKEGADKAKDAAKDALPK